MMTNVNPDVSLRPKVFEDFIGQKNLIDNLKIFCEAAQARKEPIDHILFYGPPGLGKTTLALMISNRMEVNLKITSGPTLSKIADINALLTNLKPGDVLFIDEIHRMPISIEEVLYTAMEDFAIDILFGEGNNAKTVRIKLPKFTLIGATTRMGLISAPLRDRFGISMRLEFYSLDDLDIIVRMIAAKHGLLMQDEGIREISLRSRQTPRIAIKIFKRVRDYVYAKKPNFQNEVIERIFIIEAFEQMKIDQYGLSDHDRLYLNFISDNYLEKPVGIETIASGIMEKKDTIEDMIEPYLIQIGFINRTPRGRILTQKALEHLNLLPIIETPVDVP